MERSSVLTMLSIWMVCLRGCSLPEGFSLGEKFNTDNVTHMDGMFAGCSYGGYYVYDYLGTESDEIIEKLRKH